MVAGPRIRRVGEAIDLNMALPEIGKVENYDFSEAIRRRLSPIGGMGDQQNMFEARQADRRQDKRNAAAYQDEMGRQQAAQQAVMDIISGQRFQGQPLPEGFAAGLAKGKWLSPVGNANISFGFGEKYKTPVAGNTHHRGIDFGVPIGTQVVSPYSGKIISAGWDNSGFGNAIRADYGGGLTGIFGHLSEINKGIRPGMEITPGMLLALSGSSGNSTGPHLHFQLNQNGVPINPSSFFGW